MVGVIVLNILFNTIIFSNIFWLLTFLSKYFYSSKYFLLKHNFYECGFRSLIKFQISYNINFILLLLFLLIYDGEFLIIIPFALNLLNSTLMSQLLVLFFIFWLLFVLFLDYIYNTLEWQVYLNVSFYLKHHHSIMINLKKSLNKLKPVGYFLNLYHLYNLTICSNKNEKLIKLSKKQIIKLL